MKIFAATDVGKKREMNQDYFKIEKLNDNASVMIVCDGMGGASAGNVASELATNSILDSIEILYKDEIKFEDIKSMLTFSVNKANLEVFDTSQENPDYSGMGTTVVVALMKENYAFIIHAGDSRAYLLRDNNIKQITTDHSIVQHMIETNLITPEEAKHHPKRNVITRALGVAEILETDYESLNTVKNDVLLLCTDGLTNYVSEEEIINIIDKNDLEKSAKDLIDLANNRGGSDNITVALGLIN